MHRNRKPCNTFLLSTWQQHESGTIWILMMLSHNMTAIEVLHGRNNIFFFLWEKKILMQTIFIVPTIHHGWHAKPKLLQLIGYTKHAALVYSVHLIGPCYGQMRLVKSRYPLTSITWPYQGLGFRGHQGLIYFLKLTVAQALVFRSATIRPG